MTARGDYELVALISKPKGLKGEVVVAAPDDLPLRLYEGLEVWIVPPTLTGTRHTRVVQLREQGRNQLASLEEITDLTASNTLTGRYLLARTTDLKDRDDVEIADTTSDDALEGCVGSLVYDEAEGYIGIVERVEDNPAHPLLVVVCEQPKPHEVLVPYVDEIIIRQLEGRLDVRLPHGLLELNQ